MEVFAARGYRYASLEDIADRVGITRAGVLHHFGSKEQLLIEVLEYKDQADVAQFEGHRAPTGMKLLQHLVDTAELNAGRPGIVQSYAVLSAEAVTDGHPAQPWFRWRYDVLRDMVRNAVRDASASASPPTDGEIDAATVSIIAIMDGLQVQWLLRPDAVDMAAALEFSIGAILNLWGIAFQHDA